MKKHFAKIEDIIADEKVCPFPIGIIPNYMGINLCSVKGIEWLERPDGQLVSVAVLFKPAPTEEPVEEPKEVLCSDPAQDKMCEAERSYVVIGVIGKSHYILGESSFDKPRAYDKDQAYEAMHLMVVDKYNCEFDNSINKDRIAKSYLEDDNYDWIDIRTVIKFYVAPAR